MTLEKDTAILLENVSKTFQKKSSNRTIRDFFLSSKTAKSRNQIQALSDINLHIKKGDCIGIIGSNGSGKSTLLNIIMGSIRPNQGSLLYTSGKLMRLTLGMGVDKNLSARDNIYVNGSILGLSFKKIGFLFDDIISFSGLEKFIDTPVKFYSKGMRQRLLFAIAMYAEADVFLLDEFFGGVGDEDYKKKSDIAFEEKIMQGKTVVIVSHSMGIIKKYAHNTIWLHQGKIKLAGNTTETVKEYIRFSNTINRT